MGANTAQQFISGGLLDEIHLHLVPVFLEKASDCSITSALRRLTWN
jgi:dihydrofolate reductase